MFARVARPGSKQNFGEIVDAIVVRVFPGDQAQSGSDIAALAPLLKLLSRLHKPFSEGVVRKFCQAGGHVGIGRRLMAGAAAIQRLGQKLAEVGRKGVFVGRGGHRRAA